MPHAREKPPLGTRCRRTGRRGRHGSARACRSPGSACSRNGGIPGRGCWRSEPGWRVVGLMGYLLKSCWVYRLRCRLGAFSPGPDAQALVERLRRGLEREEPPLLVGQGAVIQDEPGEVVLPGGDAPVSRLNMSPRDRYLTCRPCPLSVASYLCRRGIGNAEHLPSARPWRNLGALGPFRSLQQLLTSPGSVRRLPHCKMKPSGHPQSGMV